MMPKKKSRVFIALGTSLLKWHAILGRGVFFVNTPRWTRVKSFSGLKNPFFSPMLGDFGDFYGFDDFDDFDDFDNFDDFDDLDDFDDSNGSDHSD